MQLSKTYETIYDALRDAAPGKPCVAIERGVMFAAAATGMVPKLVRQYLNVLDKIDVIDMDGHTIWLTRDYGPRVLPRKRELKEIKRDKPKVAKRADRILAAERRKAEKRKG